MGPGFSILVLTNGFYLLGRRQEADVVSPPMDFFITDHYQNINMRLESVSAGAAELGVLVHTSDTQTYYPTFPKTDIWG